MIGILSAGLLAGSAGFALPAGRVTLAQLVIRSRVVVRVQTNVPPPPLKFIEKKGPRCLPMGDLLGAAVIADNSVDFIVRGGTRFRARFSNSCPALDYYSGFYIAPTEDHMICANRDVVRSRSGGECAVERFRILAPKPDKSDKASR